MTEYVTGQIYGWNGGECPVHPKTVVQIWTRGGGPGWAGYAWDSVWMHEKEARDIVCFQVITPYAEPKVIWVNEFADGRVSGSTSEEEVKYVGSSWHTRIAVKYVEVK